MFERTDDWSSEEWMAHGVNANREKRSWKITSSTDFMLVWKITFKDVLFLVVTTDVN